MCLNQFLTFIIDQNFGHFFNFFHAQSELDLYKMVVFGTIFTALGLHFCLTLYEGRFCTKVEYSFR